MTVQPESWEYSATGIVSPDSSQPSDGLKQCPASIRFQPKFWPDVPARMTSISSHVFCPTSPIQRSPVDRSNENRHGFRSPRAKISGDAPDVDANGLSAGIAYALPSL